MKGRWIIYTARELAWIKRHSTEPRRVAHARFCQVFGRTDVTVDSFKQLCLRRGWKTGRTGCFPKGHVPDNKGKRMPYNANSAATQFKKGSIPPNRKWIGHERVDPDGYVWISVAERNPHTGHARRYVPKHKYLWEKLNGPVPKGYVLKSKDGHRRNTDPSNWILIPQSLLPFLNGHRGPSYDDAPSELKPAILTMAKLKRARFDKVPSKRGAA